MYDGMGNWFDAGPDWADDNNGWTITEEEIEMEAIEYNIRNKEWLTKEGKRLKIKDMETSHIINTIKMINRNRWCYAYEYTKLFEAELKRRGIEWI